MLPSKAVGRYSYQLVALSDMMETGAQGFPPKNGPPVFQAAEDKAPTALRGVGEPVIVHYEDSQRLGHIQHRKRGKKNSVDAANLPTTFLSDLHGAIDLHVTYSLDPPTIE